jgi:hypothetical protein
MNPFKLIFDVVGKLFKLLLAPFKGREQEIIVKVAIPVIESVSKIDLDGDGRVAATDEMLVIARELNLTWIDDVFQTIDELRTLNRHDFRMWLACLRLAASLVREFGPGYLPALDRVRSIVNAAYTLFVKGRT